MPNNGSPSDHLVCHVSILELYRCWCYVNAKFVTPAGVSKFAAGLVTTEEEVLTPGPEGRLISTDERMQQVRQAQSESPAPASTDGEWLML